MISKARSGSNQLAAYLNQVPGCRCYGEIFKPNFPNTKGGWKGIAARFASTEEALALHRDDLCAFWDRLVASHGETNRIVGARIFYTDRRSSGIWENRVFHPDSLVIHLWRDSIFDSYVSLMRAKASDKWVVRKGEAVDASQADELRFDVEAYLDYRQKARRRFGATELMLQGRDDSLSVEYAEIAQPNRLALRLGAFLGKEVTLKSTLEKQTRRAPISYLDNPQDAAPFVDDRLSVPEDA